MAQRALQEEEDAATLKLGPGESCYAPELSKLPEDLIE